MTIETLAMLVLAASTQAPPRSAFNRSSAGIGDPTDRTASAASSARPDDEGRDDDQEEEEAASLADVPQAVREAIQRVAGPSRIQEVEKATRDGVVTYEAEYRADGEEHSVKISAAGEVLAVEKELAPAALPPEVRAAAHKRLPGGVIREAQVVYVAGGASPSYYQVEVKVGRRTQELNVRPSGEIIQDIR